MIFKVLATRDIKANVFGIPMFVPHIGLAIRSFGDECRRKGDPQNVLGNHPEDFELVQLGEYDDESGCFLTRDGIPAGDTKSWGHLQLAVGSSYKD